MAPCFGSDRTSSVARTLRRPPRRACGADVAYRRVAKPSGGALDVAKEIAARRLDEAREAEMNARAALVVCEQHASEVRRSHDEIVDRLEEARLRALRLAIALSPADSVPPGLRESLDRDARSQHLRRALDGRASERAPGKVPSVEEAAAALQHARTERARALAALLPELGRLQREARRAAEALREAEDEVRRWA